MGDRKIKEYMIKGFAMDDERLKGNGGSLSYADPNLKPETYIIKVW